MAKLDDVTLFIEDESESYKDVGNTLLRKGNRLRITCPSGPRIFQ
jgi:hypothetical protein